MVEGGGGGDMVSRRSGWCWLLLLRRCYRWRDSHSTRLKNHKRDGKSGQRTTDDAAAAAAAARAAAEAPHHHHQPADDKSDSRGRALPSKPLLTAHLSYLPTLNTDLSSYLPIYIRTCLPIYLSIFLPTYLLAYLSTTLPTGLVYLSACIFLCCFFLIIALIGKRWCGNRNFSFSFSFLTLSLSFAFSFLFFFFF